MGRYWAMKKKYLTVYDYGTGGAWTYIMASSADEILNKYPRLKIVDPEPKWFTDEDRRTTNTVDIDDDPDKFLVLMTKS